MNIVLFLNANTQNININIIEINGTINLDFSFFMALFI